MYQHYENTPSSAKYERSHEVKPPTPEERRAARMTALATLLIAFVMFFSF